VVYTTKRPFLVLFVTGYGYPLNCSEVNYSPLSKKKFGQILLIITHQENEIPQIKTPPPALEGESVPEYNKVHMRAMAP